MRTRIGRWGLVVVTAWAVSACAVNRPPTEIEAPTPPAWMAPVLPHEGSTEALAQWWSRWQDPTLVAWIERAQALSPGLAEARTRVLAARAQRLAQETLTGPQVQAVVSANRGVAMAGLPVTTTLSGGVQASWALDVWGGGRASVAQARAEQSAAQAGWHAARVLVASELAQLYFGWHACQRLLAVTQADQRSREVTQGALLSAERAGLVSSATVALARAGTADARARQAQQAQQCDAQVKGLVALTGVPEPELRQTLARAATPALPEGGATPPWLQRMLSVPAVPAAALRQRPDVWQAQATLAAAAHGVGVAQAQLWPSISLAGSWLSNNVRQGPDFNTWSVGPLSVSVPLVGREALNARAELAQSRYEAATTAYSATLRQAVSEVEQALVRLDALAQRGTEVAQAVAGYQAALSATEQRHRAGLASLTELEESRRVHLAAQNAAVAVQLERVNTWIDLYVALGGGFDPASAELLEGERR